MRQINIAIDGYSSCGKSTLAKALAEHLKYVYIDSGAMYRAVTLYGMKNGMIINGHVNKAELIRALPQITIKFIYHPDTHKAETLLNGENVEGKIRNLEVSSYVSEVSKISEVRQRLVSIQRELGENGGVVMDGRDIGTVVFPDAELKIFVTAKPEIRAERRLTELQEKGIHASYADVIQNLNLRDYEDTHRALDPLKQADDAILLDNSNLSREEQFQKCMSWVEEKLSLISS